jgi:hypothetical protein
MFSTSSCSAKGHPEVRFEIDEEMASSAEWLVRYFEEQMERGERFESGLTVQVGWMITQLKVHAECLEVWEPDFEATPIRWCRSVNNTVGHLILQRSICELLGCEPDFPSIRQAGICSPGFPASEAFIMSRDQPEASDSGWVFAEHGYGGSDGEFVSLYQIAMQRSRVVAFMALPATASVLVGRGRIEARLGDVAVSSDDSELLRRLAAGC